MVPRLAVFRSRSRNARRRAAGAKTPAVGSTCVSVAGLPLANEGLVGTASLLGLALTQSRRHPWALLSRQAGWFFVHPAASRIFAETPEQLLAAQRSLLDPNWSRGTLRSSADRPGVEKCLDLFFLEACLQWEAALPLLAERGFRLLHWPDLGGEEPRYPWVLRLAGAIARQGPITVSRLAQQQPEEPGRINALFWALWASGALERAPPAG